MYSSEPTSFIIKQLDNYVYFVVVDSALQPQFKLLNIAYVFFSHGPGTHEALAFGAACDDSVSTLARFIVCFSGTIRR